MSRWPTGDRGRHSAGRWPSGQPAPAWAARHYLDPHRTPGREQQPAAGRGPRPHDSAVPVAQAHESQDERAQAATSVDAQLLTDEPRPPGVDDGAWGPPGLRDVHGRHRGGRAGGSVEQLLERTRLERVLSWASVLGARLPRDGELPWRREMSC